MTDPRQQQATPMSSTLTLDALASRLALPLPARARTSWFDAEARLGMRTLAEAEWEQVLLDVVRFLRSSTAEPSGAHRVDAWRRGWGEILDRVAAGLTYEKLCPQYFKYDYVRADREYVGIGDPLFEFALCHAVKSILYTHYIQDGDRIVDFGTGTGANIYLLARLFEKSEIVGSDWAEPSVALVDKIGAEFGGRARGARLDMFGLNGREQLGSVKDAVVLSVHAFEQLGPNWGPILGMLLEDKPKLCVQIEPIFENYDENNLLDCMGRLYHLKRNYLVGYQTELLRLRDEGKVEIIDMRRLPFGTMMHDTYGILVWRPV